MPDYKEMYYALFRKVSKVIEQLQEIQQKTEEMYLQEEQQIIIFPKEKQQ